MKHLYLIKQFFLFRLLKCLNKSRTGCRVKNTFSPCFLFFFFYFHELKWSCCPQQCCSLTHLILLKWSWRRMRDVCHYKGSSANNGGIKKGPLLSQWFQLGNPDFQLPRTAAEPTSAHWRTPLSFQFREPRRSLPVINTPQVGEKKKTVFMDLGTFMTSGGRKTCRCCERRPWFSLLFDQRPRFTGFCNCWIWIDPNDHLKLSLTRAGSAVTSISFVY